VAAASTPAFRLERLALFFFFTKHITKWGSAFSRTRGRFVIRRNSSLQSPSTCSVQLVREDIARGWIGVGVGVGAKTTNNMNVNVNRKISTWWDGMVMRSTF
jgi:hypothetical protein